MKAVVAKVEVSVVVMAGESATATVVEATGTAAAVAEAEAMVAASAAVAVGGWKEARRVVPAAGVTAMVVMAAVAAMMAGWGTVSAASRGDDGPLCHPPPHSLRRGDHTAST